MVTVPGPVKVIRFQRIWAGPGLTLAVVVSMARFAAPVCGLVGPWCSKARAAVFVDVFNITNSNTAVNINWRGGTSFERATTVLGPRIAKAGVKFDW